MILPAISIQQPWPHAIFHLGKDVENRAWKLPQRYVDVPVLVHAGKRIDEGGLRYLHRYIIPSPSELRRGGIVGMVIFTGFTGCCGPESKWAEKGIFLQWWIGFKQALPFHPCKGRLGFFDVDYPYPLPECV